MIQLPTVEMPGFRPVTADPGPRSFRIDLGEVAAAQAVPVLDVRSFAAAAGTSIGDGLQGLGKGLGQIAEQQMASINRQAVNGASVKLEEASNQIAALFEKEQDERKWPAIFQEEAAKWKEVLLKDTSLSPVARDAIEQKHAAWQVSGLGSVARSSHDRTLKRELEDREGARITAIHRRQFDEADSITAEQESLGLISSGTAAKQRVQTADMREKLAKEDLITSLYDEANADPRAFLEKYKERGDMDPAIHSRMVNHAQQVDREAVASDADKFQEAIANGTITVPLEVDKWDEANPRITASMREAMRSRVIRKNDATAQANIEARAPEIASQLYSEVKAFDWKRDGQEKYWKLRMRIDELPTPIAGEVSGPLEMKFPGRAGNAKAAPENYRVVEDTLESLLDRGAFGPHASGEADLSELFPQVSKGAYKAEFPLEKERAIRLKAETGAKMRRWLDANPDATPEQAQKKLYEVVPESSRAGLFDMLDAVQQGPIQPVAGPETTPGTPKGNEMLPDNPGPGENILLPFPPPQ